MSTGKRPSFALRLGPPKTAALSAALVLAAACASSTNPSEGEKTSAPTTSAAVSAAAPAPKIDPPATREGSAVVRSPQNDVVFVADEDHSALRVLPLPIAADTKVTSIPLPGHPAQVLASRDRVLVTIRDLDGGGGLLIFKREGELGLKEAARVALPVDAWGMALSPDESFVLVSSPWAARVSVVELESAKVRATVTVGREPRGITILLDGKRAYVSHLVGDAITKVDGIDGANPTAARLDFPASPLRSPPGKKLPASLGYSVVASPKGDRMFFPRHALGAIGPLAWFGTAAVDVWLTATDAPLLPAKQGKMPSMIVGALGDPNAAGNASEERLESGADVFIQPRAAVYRAKTRTLLVASEGTDQLVELDALMSDPTLAPMRKYDISQRDNKYYDIATSGGAPSGIALSREEDVAFVYCRTTDELLSVLLAPGEGHYRFAPPISVHLVDEGPEGAKQDESFSIGRSLYYNATDEKTSEKLACAGCHPDGRDDGFVWHETQFKDSEGVEIVNFMASLETVKSMDQRIILPPELGGYGCNGSTTFQPTNVEGDPEKPTAAGYPRQTPMLAGRVGAAGPYGWHSESPDLASRLTAGFGLHRWRQGHGQKRELDARATHLAKFIRTGLVPPAKKERTLTDEEQKGKTIFESATAQCTRCHAPATGFTDRVAMPLPVGPTLPGFAKEENAAFKTPSLLHVGGTAPYFHDGRFATLTDVIEKNADRMGKTSHLSAEEKKALVAYLETL